MVTLQTVEIPGYREAVKRETQIRDTAFLGGLELLCGVEVVPLSLERLIWLEQARNGFLVPCRFLDADEMLAHALQVPYFCSPDFMLPSSPKPSLWLTFKEGLRQHGFFQRVKKHGDAATIIKDIEEFINDSFMDAPTGSGQGQSHASYPAYIVDKFAEAGLPFTYQQIMQMPLKRLWQHYRCAVARMYDAKLTNPSDEIATSYLANVHRN